MESVNIKTVGRRFFAAEKRVHS